MEKLRGDELWKLRKDQANKIAGLYRLLGMTDEWYKIKNCATQLEFIHGYPEEENSSIPQRLIKANFCRLRHCPICQWRRSVRWQAKAFQALPKILRRYPNGRWLFLTLTVKNCEVFELRKTINKINGAFKKWTQEEYWVGSGWIKSLEVTRGESGEAHPHLHILILSKSNYFGRNYINQQQWRNLWGKYMQLNYDPWVHISAVKPEQIEKTIPEIAKYQCKPQELIDKNGEWLFDLHYQLKGSRAIAVGGALREFFPSRKKEEEEDMIGESTTKIMPSPITSTWKWKEDQELQTYQPEYKLNNEPIDFETALENFMAWAGV